MPASRTRRQHALQEAKTFITLPRELDVSARLAAQNLCWGMGKVLQALRTLDQGAKAMFIASPDFTITRSEARWGSGFAYGGLLHLKCATALVLLELRPNTCGALLARLKEHQGLDTIRRRLIKHRAHQPQLNWDYGRKNHFINIYREPKTDALVVLIHGCPRHLKADTKERPGLYFDRSPYWQAKLKKIATDFGPVPILLEDAAIEYWDYYQQAEQISLEERKDVVTTIFGEADIVCNVTHEGMEDLTTYYQGCHLCPDYTAKYPLMTALGKPAYIVQASKTAFCNKVLNEINPNFASLLPHGTGYHLDSPGRIENVELLTNGQVLFSFEDANRVASLFTNFSHTPYSHRHPSNVKKWEAQGELSVEESLHPLLCTKL